MKKIYLFFFLILFLFINKEKVKASHLIGAEINYKYIGGTTYEVYVTVYRDCGPNAQADFDGATFSVNPNDVFTLGVENLDNSNDKTYVILPFNKSEVVNISNSVSNPCLIIKNPVCVQKHTYKGQITLNSATSRYRLVYQRCCRNNSVLNVKKDNFSFKENQYTMPGMTVWAEIPPTVPNANNSAKYKNLPPNYICKGFPFYFDHSAQDIDGDSLVYSIITPKAGLSADNPFTNNPSSINVKDINWNNPFSLQNVLGGTPNLSIDSSTGLLTCFPSENYEGLFSVSVECKEYRNGVLINTFMRDFQFMITDCNKPYADIPVIDSTRDILNKIGIYKNDCQSYVVDFANTSIKADSYKWNFGDPNSGTNNISTEKNPTHTYSDTGTYIATLYAFKNVNGTLCFDSMRAKVLVYPLFKTDIAFNGLFCQNNNISINDSSFSTYSKNFNYSWFIDGTLVNNNKNFNHFFSNPKDYYIKLTIVDEKGCTGTKDTFLKIYQKPIIGYIAENPCQFENAIIKCNSIVDNSQTIIKNTWKYPDGTIKDSCIINYYFPLSGQYTFKLISTTNNNCVDSSDLNITVHPKPNVTSTLDTSICINTSVVLNAFGANQYIWSPDSIIANPNLATIVATPKYPDTTIFKVIGKDNNGCSDTSYTKVTFFQKQFISAGIDTSVCLNLSSTLYKNSVILDGQGVFNSINWSPTATLNNPNILNPTATPTSNTQYIITAIDTNGCTISDSVMVFVLNPDFDIIPTKDTFYCQYDTIKIEVLEQGTVTQYQWNVLGQTNPYWLSNANIRDPFIFALDTTTYILSLSNYCYTKNDTIVINPIELPKSLLPKDDSICNGDTYNFNANPSIETYLWSSVDTTLIDIDKYNPSASPNITTKYFLSMIDKYGCKNIDSTTIIVYYPPTLAISGLSPYLCQGDSLFLTAYSDSFVTFLWTPQNYISDNTKQQVYVFPPESTRYFLKVMNSKKCFVIDTIDINVEMPIEPIVDTPMSFCKGKYTTLNAKGGLFYLWSPNINISDTILPNPQVYPDTSLYYQVKISNHCFIDSLEVYVEVDTLPTAIVSEDTTIFRGERIHLEVKTLSSNKVEWSPKTNLEAPYNKFVYVTPLDTTKYYVSITNHKQCSILDSVMVNVYGKNVLLIPNAFSPNSDNVNDVFRVAKYLNIKTLNYFKVWDRWGNLIFNTDDIEEGWDGTYKNNQANIDVYIWQISIITYEGETIIKSGNVSLLR